MRFKAPLKESFLILLLNFFAVLQCKERIPDLDPPKSLESRDEISDQTAQESKHRVFLKSSPQQQTSPKFKIKLQNVTKDEYEIVRWYSEPTADVLNLKHKNNDLSAQSTSYANGYREYRDDHSNESRSPETASFSQFHEASYRKPRRKHKKICSRLKKNNPGAEESDMIVHSRTKNGVEVSHYSNLSPGTPSTEHIDRMKFTNIPPGHISTRFTSHNLLGIPKLGELSHVHKEDGNHFHLHNHHHHYGLDGKKIDPANKSNSYMTLLSGIGKLRNMLSNVNPSSPNLNFNKLSEIFANSGKVAPNINQESLSVNSYETNENIPPAKKGYHYTGPHESYGRKTYRRYKSPNSEINSGFENGDSTHKYGAGSYNSNEDSKHDNYYYNAPNDSYKDNPGDVTNSHSSYNSEPHGPHPDFSEHGNKEGTGDYSQSNGDNYRNHYDNSAPGSFESGHLSRPIDTYSNEGYQGEPYPPPHHSQDSPPPLQSPQDTDELKSIPPIDVTHSALSYPQGPEEIPYDPRKEHLYKNMKPDPDPLTIPKNARVIEHFIRLHPRYYAMYPQPIVDIHTASNFPIPVHKLMVNPLKQHFIPPVAVRPPPHFNQLLKAYQTSLHHRWA